MHPNIVCFKDVFASVAGDFHLVMELGNKDLLSILNSDHHYDNLTSDVVLKYFYQILEAVRYIHSRNIIHRDVVSNSIP